MNIIEAWKKAREGQRIESKSTWSMGIKKERDVSLMDTLLRGCSDDETLLADDWEVVKEVKHFTFLAVGPGTFRFNNLGTESDYFEILRGDVVKIEREG